MSNEEKLRTFGLSSLEKGRLRGDLTALYSNLRKGNGEGSADLFFLVTNICKQHKDAPGEVQNGHYEKFLYHEGGEILEQDS